MSVPTSVYQPGLEGELPRVLNNLWKFVKCLFGKREVNHFARLYHSSFSYGLVPDTAISDFNNMGKITSIYSGDCYIYIFQGNGYKGWYRIVDPGEKIAVEECGSLIISMAPIAIGEVQKKGKAPEYCWELSGPMYMMHFSAAYRYA